MNIQLPTLYLALAALIGIFIGLLVASLFGNKESQPQKKEPPKDIVKDGYGEVARLWYTPAGKRILMEMDGGHYRDFAGMTKDQQAKAIRLAELLRNWTGGEPLTQAETQPASALYQPIVQDQKYVEPAYEYQEQEKDITDATPIDAAAETATGVATSPFTTEYEDDSDVVSVLKQSLNEAETGEVDDLAPNVSLSITQQIGAILEEMVKGTNMEEKNIKLIENDENGVDVCVGVEVYPGIDAVPYPLVRQLIHDAVLRWEQENESQQRMGM